MSSGAERRKLNPRSSKSSWRGREPEIKEDAVGGHEAVGVRLRSNRAEVGVDDDDPAAEAAQALGCRGDGLGVGVESQDAPVRGGRLEDGGGVSGVAEGTVDVGAARPHGEPGDDLGGHDRLVVYVAAGGHRPVPASVAARIVERVARKNVRRCLKQNQCVCLAFNRIYGAQVGLGGKATTT